MLTKWQGQLIHRVQELGGFVNAHLHLDRANTFNGDLDMLLEEKQKKISDAQMDICEVNLIAREYVIWFQQNDYRQAWTTADNANMQDLLSDIRDGIGFDLKIGAYAPMGLDENLKDRVKTSDFVCGTPKIEPDFKKACCALLDIAGGKELHLHIDQANSPCSHELEMLCDLRPSNTWAIHGISPSCYENKRFFRLIDKMLKHDVGLICCPSAAIGMSQDRNLVGPLHNSIARLKEMYEAGIKIRLGSDNISDMFSPSTGPDLLTEIIIASNAVRWYDIEAWANMASSHLG